MLATEDAADRVVVKGTGEVVTEAAALDTLLGLMNAKYHTDYSIEFLDPAVNATVRMRPVRVFGLRHDDFPGSPTRWTFGTADRHPPAEPPGR